jgi:hypothetical protein
VGDPVSALSLSDVLRMLAQAFQQDLVQRAGARTFAEALAILPPEQVAELRAAWLRQVESLCSKST